MVLFKLISLRSVCLLKKKWFYCHVCLKEKEVLQQLKSGGRADHLTAELRTHRACDTWQERAKHWFLNTHLALG